LKQLQLIQILRINPTGTAAAADSGAKPAGINHLAPAPEHAKAESGNADTAFCGKKCGKLAGWRFTAR